jgi:hypothetical protein
MTDEQHFDAALASVYDHQAATRHGRRFFVSMNRLEMVCPKCGEVLYEGPVFEDKPLPVDFRMFRAAKERPTFRTERHH